MGVLFSFAACVDEDVEPLGMKPRMLRRRDLRRRRLELIVGLAGTSAAGPCCLMLDDDSSNGWLGSGAREVEGGAGWERCLEADWPIRER